MKDDNVIELKDFLKDLPSTEYDTPAQVLPFPSQKEEVKAKPEKITASKVREDFAELFKRTTELQQDLVSCVQVLSNIELELFRTSGWVLTIKEALTEAGTLSESEFEEAWKKHVEEPQKKALQEQQEQLSAKQDDK